MADYYVMFNGTQYDVESYSAGLTKAKELGPEAVLYINAPLGGSGRLNMNCVKMVFTANSSYNNTIYAGIGSGTTELGADITIEGGSFSDYVVAANSGGTMTGDSVLNLNGGNLTYVVAIQGGTSGNITINLNGATIAQNLSSFARANGSVIDGDLTYNISAGSTKFLWAVGGYGGQSGTINGKVVVNLSGGTIQQRIQTTYKSPASTINGGVWYNLTGGVVGLHYIYGTGESSSEVVKGGVHILVDGFSDGSAWIIGAMTGKTDGVDITMKSGLVNILTGGTWNGSQEYDVNITMEGGATSYITGANYNPSTLTGDVTINVSGGTITNTFNAAGNKAGSVLNGDVVANISGATTVINTTSDFNISGSGTQVGNATLNISDGSIGGTISGLGKRNTGSITGNMTLNISGGTFTNETAILGVGKICTGEGAGAYGDLEINITGGAFDGSIFLLGGAVVQIGNASLNIGEVSIGGSVYAGSCGWTEDEEVLIGYIEGSQSITVDGATIGGVLSGIGTAEVEQGLEEATSTLAVGSKGVTVSDMVANFTNITIAAGGSIKAGAVVAAAITATASAEDGAYLLASGFAAQDSVITVVNGGGSTIGTVTLSEAVTSGSFNVGSDAYTVAISDSNLYLTKNADVPVGPIEPPVVESKFTADVVLTITDTTHAYFGATGAWKVMDDQKIVWQDLSTLSGDYQILGLGKTAADKAMSDVYVYSASNKYIGAYVTDANGAVAGFES
ncbi:MAG: hypothetical protein IJC73_07280, partial [Lentisphaeria bacterium]|nr:hypothetical protein [Lentisphaeria bacterium]